MSRLINPWIQYLDEDGNPYSTGTVYFGLPNQDPVANPKVPYSDAALTVAIAASQVLDDKGMFQTAIYLSGGYSMSLFDVLGNPIRTEPEIYGAPSGNDGFITAKDTIAAAKADDNLVVGSYVRVAEYTAGNPIDALYLVASGAGTDDGGSVINSDTASLFNLQLVDDDVTIVNFGAENGGAGSVNEAAYINCANYVAGYFTVPEGSFTVTATTANSELILSTLNKVKCYGTLNVELVSGLHSYTAQTVINSPFANKISITGVSALETTASSQVSSSGSAKAYSVVLGVVSSASVAIGDYAMIAADVTGTGDYDIHAGVWKITAVDAGGANRITVLNTCHTAAFPTNTLTGGTVSILKTQIKYTGSDGFRFEGGGALNDFNNLAIVGDWNVSAATGTAGAHGIVTSTPVVTGGGSSNSDYDTGGVVRCGSRIGVSAFGEQGVAISGRGNMVANFIASSSNRKRGIYAEGGHIRCKFSVTNGNGEDGVISDTTGFIQAALSISSGNGLNGYWSTNNSMLNASSSIASNNLQNGYECRGLGRLGADSSLSKNNGTEGYNASDGGMIDADSSTADGNGDEGYNAVNGSVIDCNTSTAQNNIGFGYEAINGSVINAPGATLSANGGTYNSKNAIIIQADSSLFPGTTDLGILELYNSTRANKLIQSVSSIGDVTFELSSVERVRIKNDDGALNPIVDNTQPLGASGARWSEVFAGNGTINTSDQNEKTLFAPIPDSVLIAWGNVEWQQFKFLDAVDRKGDSARVHYGLVAQQVKSVFESAGLDPFEYGLLCFDEWEAEYDDDGNITLEAGSRYGLRYDECQAIESAYVRKRLDGLNG